MNSSVEEEDAKMGTEITQIELDRSDGEKQTRKTIKSNKVEPDFSKEASQDPTTSVAITKTWRVFVGSSTLHGLQYVFTSRTLVRRILWALFLVAAIVWFSYQSSKLLKKYFSYPATTKVSLVYEGSPEFPAVSICNFNRFKKSVIMAKEYDQLLSQFERKVFGLNTDNFTTDFSKYRDLNITEFYLSAGHQINDTLHACVWSGTFCDYRNFTPVLTSMGLCHTFNSGKGGESILKVKQAGSEFGLQITLNVHRQEYYGVTSFQTGFKIFIHHQGTPPMVSQLGFAVGPGTSTFAAIHKQRVLNLPYPHESNCFNETVSNIPGYPKYTIPSCMLICQTKFVIEKCGCREVGMPDLNNTKVCDLDEYADCLVQEKNNFYLLKHYECDCPVPCDSITFKPALSYADFPSSSLVSSVVKSLYPPDAPIVTPEIIKAAEEYMRQNNVQLHIYFQELNYQLIQEIPAYDSESLLGEIGGQVGLCVGASLLTALEFIDVILSMIKIRLGFR